MIVDFAFCLVSFTTVTQRFQHLINLILSDGFRETRESCGVQSVQPCHSLMAWWLDTRLIQRYEGEDR